METRTENGYLVVQTVITVTDVVGEHHPRAEIFLQWGRLGRGVWLWRLRVLDNAPRASAELPVGLDGWCTADLVPSAVLGFLELVMHRPPADGRR